MSGICAVCNGSGEGCFEGVPCYACKGSGKQCAYCSCEKGVEKEEKDLYGDYENYTEFI
jgi:hypothetical protein